MAEKIEQLREKRDKIQKDKKSQSFTGFIELSQHIDNNNNHDQTQDVGYTENIQKDFIPATNETLPYDSELVVSYPPPTTNQTHEIHDYNNNTTNDNTEDTRQKGYPCKWNERFQVLYVDYNAYMKENFGNARNYIRGQVNQIQSAFSTRQRFCESCQIIWKDHYRRGNSIYLCNDITDLSGQQTQDYQTMERNWRSSRRYLSINQHSHAS